MSDPATIGAARDILAVLSPSELLDCAARAILSDGGINIKTAFAEAVCRAIRSKSSPPPMFHPTPIEGQEEETREAASG